MNVSELTREIRKLSDAELMSLHEWMANYLDDRWDPRIEKDLQRGRRD